MADSLLKALKSLNCPVCLDVLKDPVTIPCGHSYCLSCIEDCWKKDHGDTYNCPQCRQTFSPKPVLKKNTTLAELAEELKKTGQEDHPPVSQAGSDDVECDICTEIKHKAVKSCLVCLASYCEAHIQSHYRSAPLKKHKLVDAYVNLQDHICLKHDKLLEMFCRNDNNFICYLCAMDEHKNHNIFSVAAERTARQNELVQLQYNSNTSIEQRESRIKEVNDKMKSFRFSAQAAVDESEKIFTDLIQSLKERSFEVKELIRNQELRECSVANEHLKTLEQEIKNLRKRNSELEKISQIDNNNDFVKRFLPLRVLPKSETLSVVIKSPKFNIDEVKEAASSVMEEVEQFYKMELVKSSTVHSISLIKSKTRVHFLKYYRHLTIEPQGGRICLSDGNRKLSVTSNSSPSYHPSVLHPISQKLQVFCKEVLHGRCYWEVEQFNRDYFIIGLDYKRTKEQSVFGSSDRSWSLSCLDSKYFVTHRKKQVKVQVSSPISKIGVFLNHSAGTLSFYNVSETMTLIHKFQTSFARPLRVGFEFRVPSNGFQLHTPN